MFSLYLKKKNKLFLNIVLKGRAAKTCSSFELHRGGYWNSTGLPGPIQPISHSNSDAIDGHYDDYSSY